MSATAAGPAAPTAASQPYAPTQPAGAQPTPTPPDPGEELKKKKADLTKLLGDQATLQRSVDGLKREVEVLEQALSDVDKVVQEYAAALPKLQQDRDALAAILAEHSKEVEAVLGPKAKQVRDAVGQVDADIAAAQADVASKEQAWKAAEADQATAAEGATTAEGVFTWLKQVLAAEQKKLKDAAALKDQERKADADNEYKKQCYLLQDLDTALRSITLMEPDKLKTSLYEAVDMVKQRKGALAAAKEKSDSSKQQLEEARKKQGAAVAGRTAAILEAIQAIS